MKKFIVLGLVLCLAGVASATTVTLTGSVGDLDADANTFYLQIDYLITDGGVGTCAGGDILVAIPSGLSGYDDIMLISSDDETGYNNVAAILGHDDRESFLGDNLNAVIVDDGVLIDQLVATPAHADPGTNYFLVTAGALPALGDSTTGTWARLGFEGMSSADAVAQGVFLGALTLGPGGMDGTMVPAGVFVPEPTTMLLLLAGVVALIRRK